MLSIYTEIFHIAIRFCYIYTGIEWFESMALATQKPNEKKMTNNEKWKIFITHEKFDQPWEHQDAQHWNTDRKSTEWQTKHKIFHKIVAQPLHNAIVREPERFIICICTSAIELFVSLLLMEKKVENWLKCHCAENEFPKMTVYSLSCIECGWINIRRHVVSLKTPFG